MARMKVEVTLAPVDEKPIVRRLLELNSHDFSEIDGRQLGLHGEFGYPYLDHYWLGGENRFPYIVWVDGYIGGLALVRAGTPHRFGEFFIVRKHRRNGVGTIAAQEIFGLFPGEWLLEEIPSNDDAVAFWRRIIPTDFTETVNSQGAAQRFVSKP